jgi:UDP:flavonoid glycosyltransferase YjiC (YdhE family)
MRILLAATPAASHLAPILGIARLLAGQEHESMVLTASHFRTRVRATGASFASLPPAIDHELAGSPTSISRQAVDVMGQQHRALSRCIDSFRPQAVIVDDRFLGAVPLMLAPRQDRPLVACCGTSGMPLGLADQGLRVARPSPIAPHHPRAPQHRSQPPLDVPVAALKARNEAELRSLALSPPWNPFDIAQRCADLYWQAGVPDIHLTQTSPQHIRYVGLWPRAEPSGDLPVWAEPHQDGRRRIVVRQAVNADTPDPLAASTIEALADRSDLVVMVTGGGIASRGMNLARNATLMPQFAVDALLPYAHALISTTDFETILKALACGVPMALAGPSGEGDQHVGKVAKSGAAIALATATPDTAEIRAAVDRLLAVDSSYRHAAHAIADRFANYDGAAIILNSLAEELPLTLNAA